MKPFHFIRFLFFFALQLRFKKKNSLKSMEIESVVITKSICSLQVLKETFSPVLISDTLFRKVLLQILCIKVHLVSSTKFSLLFSKKAYFLIVVPRCLSSLPAEKSCSTLKTFISEKFVPHDVGKRVKNCNSDQLRSNV